MSKSIIFKGAAVAAALVAVSVGSATAASQITNHDLGTASVNTRVIQNGAVHNSDLTGHLSALVHKKSTVPGPKGAKGARGDDGVVGNILHNSHAMVVPAHSNGTDVQVTCAGGPNGDAPNGDATGYVATGGGFNVASRDPGVFISQSRNLISLTGDYSYNGKGWLVTVNNTTDSDQTVSAWVICISAPNDDSTN